MAPTAEKNGNNMQPMADKMPAPMAPGGAPEMAPAAVPP